MALLEVDNLHVTLAARSAAVHAVRGASFRVDAGRTLALVGESGCGKTTVCKAIIRLLPRPGRIVAGRILLDGRDLTLLDEEAMRRVRGREIAMIPQNPMTSLNPVDKVGSQLERPLALHRGLRGQMLSDTAREMLSVMAMPEPARALASYPHELSGGMRQRVAGAIALSGGPRLLLADEPTTALDATVQAQYLQLLRQLQVERGIAMLFVTHDLGIVASISHDVAVMYAGEVVETAPTARLFSSPRHPYTRALLAAVPPLHEAPARLTAIAGQPPRLDRPIQGCPFAARCEYVEPRCREQAPPMQVLATGEAVKCWRYA